MSNNNKNKEAEATKAKEVEATKAKEVEATKAKEVEVGKPKTKEVVEKKKFPYSVAPGKSVTSKIGVLGEGHEVLEKNLAGGKEALEKLVERKYVIKA